jgi:hypothetical protein
MKGSNVYKWIDWLVESNLPFSFVDEQVNRKYSNLKPICNKTLKIALHAVTQKVEDIITKMLPSKFALMDGTLVIPISWLYLLHLCTKVLEASLAKFFTLFR